MAERLEVCKLFISKGFSVSKVLFFAKVSRSTWYSQFKERKKPSPMKRGRKKTSYCLGSNNSLIYDSKVIKLLKGYRNKAFFENGGGYKKLAKYLSSDFGISLNHKKSYRLCKDNNLLLPSNKKKLKRKNRASINRTITSPNKLWEFDIKYGYVHGEDRFFYLLAFIDVFSRKVVGYHIGLSCKAKDLAFTLKDSLFREGITNTDNLVIRSDNGPQMTSNLLGNIVEEIKKCSIIVGHEFIPPSTPNKNAHIESFFSVVETEHFQTRFFRSFKEAYEKTCDFINFYNQRRLHGSLKYQSPINALNRFKIGIREIKNVRV